MTSQIEKLKEILFLVNNDDKIIGLINKFNSHNRKAIIYRKHRAFSLFLFDFENQSTLLQKRSNHKFTFPLLWSNTMCSHPILNNDKESNGFDGILKAINRKFQDEYAQEMKTSISESLKLMGRVSYNYNSSDDKFEENEISYIVFGQYSKDLFDYRFNIDEISEIKSVNISDIYSLVDSFSSTFSPWFRGIVKSGFVDRWIHDYLTQKRTDLNIIKLL